MHAYWSVQRVADKVLRHSRLHVVEEVFAQDTMIVSRKAREGGRQLPKSRHVA